jgi:hypothetical protein
VGDRPVALQRQPDAALDKFVVHAAIEARSPAGEGPTTTSAIRAGGRPGAHVNLGRRLLGIRRELNPVAETAKLTPSSPSRLQWNRPPLS